jgi:hypothetical protein
MPSYAGTARSLHEALTAIGLRGSVRVLDDGRWVVRVLRSLSRGTHVRPGDSDFDEWLSATTDCLEAATGVRPDVEVED